MNYFGIKIQIFKKARTFSISVEKISETNFSSLLVDVGKSEWYNKDFMA